MYKIIKIKVLKDYRIELTFNDGKNGIVDLSEDVGIGIFKLWNDYIFFEKVKIASAGYLTWDDKIDLCPDSLYLQMTGKKPEDIFPSLNQERYSA